MNLDDITWTCHVCGVERPDRFISVEKRVGVLAGGVEIGVNVRYCNDRPECVTGAGPVAEERLTKLIEGR